MKRQYLATLTLLCILNIHGQNTTHPKKKRLNFARTYFEFGGNYTPGFTSYNLNQNQVNAITNSSTFNTYLNWGGFHFWGHAEFYVSFPLRQLYTQSDKEQDFKLTESVVTGARYFPWTVKDNSFRPYTGLSWSAVSFKQHSKHKKDHPTLSDDFIIAPDLGLLYTNQGFSFRLGLKYNPKNSWEYPLSKTTFKTIKTPKFNLQLGVLYAFENSHTKDKQMNDRWNSYPRISKLKTNAKRYGDFFVGIGPSGSFSLTESSYTKNTFPYLQDQLTSENYYDIAVGYQFNQSSLFTAVSFRNPEFKTSGFGSRQHIKKRSLSIEINKFLFDYTGFAPYIGLNLAYDHIKYTEQNEQTNREFIFNSLEPGITVGWDIVPGKTGEYLILRTNLRWYPFSSFDIDGQTFNFNQLEYNLIQVIFYPDRFLKRKHMRSKSKQLKTKLVNASV